MSAPETNLETQKKRHIGPLGGMLLVVAFAAILFGLFYIFATSDDPTDEGASAPAATSEEPAAAEDTN
ncbi:MULTISPECIES: hypothetical protein [Roseovarius]|uniref:hypothetical protein n=1 Tax=Roseovarius TaxID=74030 RepID=UPI001C97127E|nr:hypothetical protein [Roseovarius atlanticus]MBY5987855.1 hypothetical protein [Roseovarius atlanticus]MBY6123246.1 hypothetical protein [Roseovarius atlanticus]MBY6147742.1 hypothetical protein [Roseovarius atlanticus]